jgi:hypothetical protein
VSCERGILASGSGSLWWLMPLTAGVPLGDRAVLLAGPVAAGCWAAPGAVAGFRVVDPGLAVDRVHGDMPDLLRNPDPPRSSW